jgi:hypothetical protein
LLARVLLVIQLNKKFWVLRSCLNELIGFDETKGRIIRKQNCRLDRLLFDHYLGGKEKDPVKGGRSS